MSGRIRISRRSSFWLYCRDRLDWRNSTLNIFYSRIRRFFTHVRAHAPRRSIAKTRRNS
ncbi:MAG: hypothetical protein AAF492_09475 [Verrucomicrobiota bacterium]